MVELSKDFSIFGQDENLIRNLIKVQQSLHSASRMYYNLKWVWQKCNVRQSIKDWDSSIISIITNEIDAKQATRENKRFYLQTIEKLIEMVGKDYEFENTFKKAKKRLHNTSNYVKKNPFQPIETIEQILSIIRPKHWNYISKNHIVYIEFGLLALSGMRVGGLIAAKKENISICERTIIVREKATKANRINRYYIPVGFVDDLNNYLNSINEEYIVPRLNALNEISIERRIERQFSQFNVNPHQLRDTINSSWSTLKMDSTMLSYLLNQDPGSVNSKHYKKKYQMASMQKLYFDEYNPYREWMEQEFGFNYLNWFKKEYAEYEFEDIDDDLDWIDRKCRKKAFRKAMM